MRGGLVPRRQIDNEIGSAKTLSMNFSSVQQWVSGLVNTSHPFLLGINGPQGSGKSTLSAALCAGLRQDGFTAIAVSIDDFYLTRAEQVELAQQFPDNPYLAQRGYPGTHDIALGTQTLTTLKNSFALQNTTVDSGSMSIPRYDKSAYQGKGDRGPESSWTQISGPINLIIIEGWMLGFTSVPESSLPNVHFKVINQFLREYQAWNELLDGFLQLQADDYRHVLQWRVEAEEKMKASGKPGMSREEVSRYIELFLPAYATYLPTLDQGPGAGPGPSRPQLRVSIGRDRLNLD